LTSTNEVTYNEDIKMKRFLAYLLLVAFGVAGFQVSRTNLSFASPNIQSDCIEPIIGNAEVIASQMIDINQDGILDQVVLYINDDVDRKDDPIYVLMALNQSLILPRFGG
jgi:hypothetical protein